MLYTFFSLLFFQKFSKYFCRINSVGKGRPAAGSIATAKIRGDTGARREGNEKDSAITKELGNKLACEKDREREETIRTNEWPREERTLPAKG